MSWLRANFRVKAQDVDWEALGGAVAGWIAGSSVNPDRRYGGLVIFSFASQLSGLGFLQISAFEAMGSTYGVTAVSNLYDSGFKFIPIAFQDVSGDGVSGGPVTYFLSASQALSVGDTSIAIIIARKPSQTVGSGIVFTSASNISVHFIAAGFIVSAPSRVR